MSSHGCYHCSYGRRPSAPYLSPLPVPARASVLAPCPWCSLPWGFEGSHLWGREGVARHSELEASEQERVWRNDTKVGQQRRSPTGTKHLLLSVWPIHPHRPYKQCLAFGKPSGEVTEAVIVQKLNDWSLNGITSLCPSSSNLVLISFHSTHNTFSLVSPSTRHPHLQSVL